MNRSFFLAVRGLFLVLAPFSLFACGYAFQGSGSILPSDIQTVAVKLAENDTTEPGLALKLTEKLISRFERYGQVKLVDKPEEADAVLYTKITSLETRTRDVTSQTDIALEQELTMTISAELRRRNGQVLYRNPSMTTYETFAGTSDVVVTSSSEFQQGGISANTLGSLGAREISRGQQEQVLDELLEETARRLYLDAVAAEF